MAGNATLMAVTSLAITKMPRPMASSGNQVAPASAPSPRAVARQRSTRSRGQTVPIRPRRCPHPRPMASEPGPLQLATQQVLGPGGCVGSPRPWCASRRPRRRARSASTSDLVLGPQGGTARRRPAPTRAGGGGPARGPAGSRRRCRRRRRPSPTVNQVARLNTSARPPGAAAGGASARRLRRPDRRLAPFGSAEGERRRARVRRPGRGGGPPDPTRPTPRPASPAGCAAPAR